MVSLSLIDTFSGIDTDQAHEQANAVLKGDGGAIGVTEDPSVGVWTRCWPVCQLV